MLARHNEAGGAESLQNQTGATLFFLKPDAVIRPYVGARILKEILNHSFLPDSFQRIKLSRSFLADIHYAAHMGKFFFEWLVDYVSFSPIVAIIFRGESVAEELRHLLGPTFPEVAAKEDASSLRARYGIYGGVNASHASDSELAANSEIANWKSRGYLKHDSRALNKVESYVEKYIDFPFVDSVRYRELCQILKANPREERPIRKRFLNLLSSEIRDNSIEIVERFADLLVKNCLMYRKS